MSTTIRKLQLPDGGIYKGEVNSIGIPNGKGECKWNDGTEYNGSWVNGEMHGVGLYTDKSGYIVKGFWMQGKLIHNFSSQDGRYEGQRDTEGSPHGKGTYEWPDGRRYEGSWVNGKMHGVGTMHYSDGRIIRGFWYDGELLHTFDNQIPASQIPKNKNKISALLVGNDYPHTASSLCNCVADVEAIGEIMRRIGIDVVILRNASENEIQDGLRQLQQKGTSEKDAAIFYFSGHGRQVGPWHFLVPDKGNCLCLERDVLMDLYDTKYRNLILIHDACNVISPISKEAVDDVYDNSKEDNWVKYQNMLHDRNVLYAFSTLNGQYASALSNHRNSMYALGLMEYINQKKLSVMKMFNNITQFVIAYSNKEFGGIIEVPHVEHTVFDYDFSLYDPED